MSEEPKPNPEIVNESLAAYKVGDYQTTAEFLEQLNKELRLQALEKLAKQAQELDMGS